ncbi:NAD(P)/FAD-dependent oxidoreductase [Cloacibacillus porcorum]
MRKVGLAIIGGGPAGLAAAVAAYEAGCRDLLILEREDSLGGILKQCIHNGFGLHTFKEELTGPEYAQRYIEKIIEYGIPCRCGTMVIDITRDRKITCVSRTAGLEEIEAGAVILAMGCRERPRGSLGIPGQRCSGIYTAGTAQRFVNMEGVMPGKKVMILGSGDIGLIMARRMTFMGAEVKGCVELMPFSAGLKRNIVQCLDDYGIPLLLSHTVVDIAGRERLEGVTVAAVDERLRPIPGTEKYYECDTLLLSVGLIPENELSAMAGVEIAETTNGAVVDESLHTSVEGIFSCGNVLHVHDLVDFVSEEAAKAGENAWHYINGERPRGGGTVTVSAGAGASGVVPQYISRGAQGEVTMMFRPRGVYKDAAVVITAGAEKIFSKRHRILTPGEMVSFKLDMALLGERPETSEITVGVEARP